MIRHRWPLLTGIAALLALACLLPGTARAEDSVAVSSTTSSEKVHSWETGANKSYLIPVWEIPVFLVILNQYDRLAYPNTVYNSGTKSAVNFFLHGHWEYDNDPFNISQLGHPYQGSMMFGFARSTGLGFWQSWAYSNVGSYVWMMAGETDNPRINGQITTGQAGTLFGEALFRMANLLLEGGGDDPGPWRTTGAALMSPPTVLNRWLFGKRFTPVFPSHDPATLLRLRLGANVTTNINQFGASNAYTPDKASANLDLEYGLPGKPGYTYERPFDYFDFHFTALPNSHEPFENVMVRGLVLGTDYEVGDNYRGIWGVYGSYDYIAPEIFRVSTTAASLGTTAQWWLSHAVALQGTALAGLGFGAAGTSNVTNGDRDYHYGATPQGLLALRLIFGDRIMLDATAREYYVSPHYFTFMEDTVVGGSEQIGRVDTSLTVRIHGHHAIGIQYIMSSRDAYYPGIPNVHQTIGTISLAYNYLSDMHFGSTEWRDGENRQRE